MPNWRKHSIYLSRKCSWLKFLFSSIKSTLKTAQMKGKFKCESTTIIVVDFALTECSQEQSTPWQGVVLSTGVLLLNVLVFQLDRRTASQPYHNSPCSSGHLVFDRRTVSQPRHTSPCSSGHLVFDRRTVLQPYHTSPCSSGYLSFNISI